MLSHPEWLSYEQLREAANEFLDEYHRERTIPVPIESLVEFDLGMDVIPVLGLRSDLRIDAFITNDLERIYCDEWVMLNAPTRYRFSLAHEVGHWWLHDKIYEGLSITKVADYRALLEEVSDEDYKRFESQANSFAGLILVPREALLEVFLTVKAKVLQAGVKAGQIDHHPTRQFVVKQIAEKFGVSEQMLEIRLERDALIAVLPGIATD